MPKCPKCKTLFSEEEGPTCDCYRERECPDCGNEFNPELFPILKGCIDHEDRLEELRELARQERNYVAYLKKGLGVKGQADF